MSKIAIIDYCGDCPLRYYKNNDLHCETTGDKVGENLPCPPNCPLPDELEATRLERERCLAIVADTGKKYSDNFATRVTEWVCAEIKERIEANNAII